MVSRFKEDPARAGPGGSNIEETGGGRGEKKRGAEVIVCRVPHVDLE